MSARAVTLCQVQAEGHAPTGCDIGYAAALIPSYAPQHPVGTPSTMAPGTCGASAQVCMCVHKTPNACTYALLQQLLCLVARTGSAAGAPRRLVNKRMQSMHKAHKSTVTTHGLKLCCPIKASPGLNSRGAGGSTSSATPAAAGSAAAVVAAVGCTAAGCASAGWVAAGCAAMAVGRAAAGPACGAIAGVGGTCSKPRSMVPYCQLNLASLTLPASIHMTKLVRKWSTELQLLPVWRC
jgi:hypothetical protein